MKTPITLDKFVKLPGYEEEYLINEFGLVYSLKKSRLLVQSTNPGGYYQVSLRKAKHQVLRRVHRLVALAFLGESQLHVNHIDGNKINNHVSNLEYVTIKTNVRHFYLKGTGLDYKNISDEEMKNYQAQRLKAYNRKRYLLNKEAYAKRSKEYIKSHPNYWKELYWRRKLSKGAKLKEIMSK